MNAITNPTAIVMDSTAVSRALEAGKIEMPSAPEPETAPAPKPIMQPDPGMAITTTVKELRAALMSCGKVTVNSSFTPILECVRIDAADDCVSVTGTDLDVMVKVSLPADVYTAGPVILPLKPLKKTLVKRKAGEPVSIEAIPAAQDDRPPQARITVGETEFMMTGFGPDDWPVLADILEGEVADIPASALAAAIADVAAAQSDEETRYYLNGVLFERTGAAFLRMAATDGHRLHVHDTGWHWPAMGVEATNAETGEVDREPQVIVPRLAIATLQHLLKGATVDRDILIESDGQRLTFDADGWRVATKAIDGGFPDFDRILAGAFPTTGGEPSDGCHHAELTAAPTLDTMQAIKAAATDRSSIARLHFAADEITGGSIDSGNHSRHPMARVNGECALEVIGFNAEFFADVAERVAVADGATMELTMTDSRAPIGIVSADKPGFTAVVMPLRV